MMKRLMKCAVAAAAVLVSGTSFAAIDYFENFDGFGAGATELSDAGWLVFANVFDDYPGCAANYQYGYGPFPAPNGGPAFSSVVPSGSASPPALAVYSDYNNGDHGTGYCIEANVFQERAFSASDAGVYEFAFNAEPPPPPDDVFMDGQRTYAFVKMLDPNAGFALTLFEVVETTTLSPGANLLSIIVDLDASFDGQILQWGFASTATGYSPTGRWYDNVSFGIYTPPPPPPPPSDVGIPTLNIKGLLILLALVGGIGAITLTRRL